MIAVQMRNKYIFDFRWFNMSMEYAVLQRFTGINKNIFIVFKHAVYNKALRISIFGRQPCSRPQNSKFHFDTSLINCFIISYNELCFLSAGGIINKSTLSIGDDMETIRFVERFIVYIEDHLRENIDFGEVLENMGVAEKAFM